MFPHVSQRIAALYKLLGLLSIPLLTIVTIVSISNVFVRGQLATWQGLAFVWAVIFAAAIEVNIVRLFFEAKMNADKGAFTLGIILAIVAGAALLIEGLQQSIGFDWSNFVVQWTIGLVVFLRVLVVVLLLAREGSRLAVTMQEIAQNEHMDEHIIYACLVHFPEPAPVQIVQETEHASDTRLHVVPNTKRRSSMKPPKGARQTPEQRIRTLLDLNPNISIRELAQVAHVSIGTAQKYRQIARKEA